MLKYKERKKFINDGYLSLSKIFDNNKFISLKKKLNKLVPNEKNIFYKNLNTF